MWVKLKSTKHLDVRGVRRTYHKGDWVEVGGQQARRWIATGDAEVPDMKAAGLITKGAGAVVRGSVANATTMLLKYAEGLRIESRRPYALIFQQTMFLKAPAPVRPELFPVGFHLLETWEAAIPLFNYDKLACHVADGVEQGRTKEIVHDLRVPLYDSRLMFVKDCEGGKRLMRAWEDERIGSSNENHALLRAVYRVKPLILALPTTWLGVGPR
jgi:hypothetical protein